MKEVQSFRKRDFIAYMVMVAVMLGLLFAAPTYAAFKNDKIKSGCNNNSTTSCESSIKNSESNLK